MDEIGVKDAEDEFRRWLEEREAILNMNRNNNKGSKQPDALAAKERVSERASVDQGSEESL